MVSINFLLMLFIFYFENDENATLPQNHRYQKSKMNTINNLFITQKLIIYTIIINNCIDDPFLHK